MPVRISRTARACVACRRPPMCLFGILWLFGLLLTRRAYALSSEIDVYTGSLTATGAFNLTLHNYYVADSARSTEFAGGPQPDHSFTGGTEWAYGAAPWLEFGVYTPIYTATQGAMHFDGAELRALFVTPESGRGFVYGVDLALDLNAAAWDTHRYALELRPVLSWRRGPWRFSLNPIIETAFDGSAAMQFTPAERLDYTLSDSWQIGLEEYAEDTGSIRHALPLSEQNQRLFAIADVSAGHWTIEPGVGIGLTSGSDRLTLKLLLSRDLP